MERQSEHNSFNYQWYDGFLKNMLFIIINIAAFWVRIEKPKPRSPLVSIQFGFGRMKNQRLVPGQSSGLSSF
jgi:hypothetical protein